MKADHASPEITLLVLAAGIGSRYGGLKQMDPFGPSGETLIDYAVYDAMRAGFSRVVFVIRREIEPAFRRRVASRFKSRVRVDYVHQELDRLPPGFQTPPTRRKPWGTGHAILVAEEAIREPFAVINGDDFYGPSSYQMLYDFLNSSQAGPLPLYALIGFTLRNTLSDFGSVSRAVCRCDQDDFLQGIVERPRIERDRAGARYFNEAGKAHPLTGDEKVSMNMWGFTPSIFDALRAGFLTFLQDHLDNDKSEFIFTEVIDELVTRGAARLRVLPSRESWFGVTHPEDKAKVIEAIRQRIARGQYPEKLWS